MTGKSGKIFPSPGNISLRPFRFRPATMHSQSLGNKEQFWHCGSLSPLCVVCMRADSSQQRSEAVRQAEQHLLLPFLKQTHTLGELVPLDN